MLKVDLLIPDVRNWTPGLKQEHLEPRQKTLNIGASCLHFGAMFLHFDLRMFEDRKLNLSFKQSILKDKTENSILVQVV